MVFSPGLLTERVHSGYIYSSYGRPYAHSMPLQNMNLVEVSGDKLLVFEFIMNIKSIIQIYFFFKIVDLL